MACLITSSTSAPQSWNSYFCDPYRTALSDTRSKERNWGWPSKHWDKQESHRIVCVIVQVLGCCLFFVQARPGLGTNLSADSACFLSNLCFICCCSWAVHWKQDKALEDLQDDYMIWVTMKNKLLLQPMLKGYCSRSGRLELTLPVSWSKTLHIQSTKPRLTCPVQEARLLAACKVSEVSIVKY